MNRGEVGLMNRGTVAERGLWVTQDSVLRHLTVQRMIGLGRVAPTGMVGLETVVEIMKGLKRVVEIGWEEVVETY